MNMSISYEKMPFLVKKAKGVYFYDDQGNKYLDCINNVTHIGHCNSSYQRAMTRQLKTLVTNSRFLYESIESASTKLLSIMPKELSRITWTNSGSESNDLAIQMAKIITGKKKVYAHEGAYHGTTTQTMEVSEYKWNHNYENPANTVIVQSPCNYRSKYSHLNSGERALKLASDFENQIKKHGDFAAFISEAMLSCGGQVIPDPTYFQQIHKVIKQNKGVYIGDEVQTGFGRLGKTNFGFEHYGVLPDIVTVGKAMGNGFPVSALICTEEIAEAFFKQGIEYFNTYGGNPLACVATEAVLDYINEHDLKNNSEIVGSYVTEELSRLKTLSQYIGDTRGMGFFQGIDFVKCPKSKEPFSKLAKIIQFEARKNGVLLSVDAKAQNVIKIKPPMIFNKKNAKFMIASIEKAILKTRDLSIGEIENIKF